VRALVELAHRLKMEVLVAGVENEESVARLKPLGCDLIQGAVIGKPLETLEFIRKFRAD
jgi:EAL domain-containing protein (putative c-di-GMP-specific phosphodiesterase class I)